MGILRVSITFLLLLWAQSSLADRTEWRPEDIDRGDFYRRLGITEDTLLTPEEWERLYIDRGAELQRWYRSSVSPQAHEDLQRRQTKLLEAYNTLRRKWKREDYDKRRAQRRERAQSPPAEGIGTAPAAAVPFHALTAETSTRSLEQERGYGPFFRGLFLKPGKLTSNDYWLITVLLPKIRPQLDALLGRLQPKYPSYSKPDYFEMLFEIIQWSQKSMVRRWANHEQRLGEGAHWKKFNETIMLHNRFIASAVEAWFTGGGEGLRPETVKRLLDSLVTSARIFTRYEDLYQKSANSIIEQTLRATPDEKIFFAIARLRPSFSALPSLALRLSDPTFSFSGESLPELTNYFSDPKQSEAKAARTILEALEKRGLLTPPLLDSILRQANNTIQTTARKFITAEWYRLSRFLESQESTSHLAQLWAATDPTALDVPEDVLRRRFVRRVAAQGVADAQTGQRLFLHLLAARLVRLELSEPSTAAARTAQELNEWLKDAGRLFLPSPSPENLLGRTADRLLERSLNIAPGSLEHQALQKIIAILAHLGTEPARQTLEKLPFEKIRGILGPSRKARLTLLHSRRQALTHVEACLDAIRRAAIPRPQF